MPNAMDDDFRFGRLVEDQVRIGIYDDTPETAARSANLARAASRRKPFRSEIGARLASRSPTREDETATMALTICRLTPADAAEFHALRQEGFRLHAREFRFAPEDEAHLATQEVAARLAHDFVVGAFDGETLVGVAGLAGFAGAKTRHKALLWGMYLRERHRGEGGADALMVALMEHARGAYEIVTLTVMRDNVRALRFYERWGFMIYGVEPAFVKTADGLYLDEALMALRLD